MRHRLKISVSKEPQTGGVVRCRSVTLREKMLTRLLGRKERVMRPVSKIKLLLDVVEDMRSLADSLQSLADAMTQGDAPETEPVQKTASPPPKEPAVTLEQVRSVLAEKSHDGKTEAIRELLQKYGAPKLSAVDPKHYPALLKDAEVL